MPVKEKKTKLRRVSMSVFLCRFCGQVDEIMFFLLYSEQCVDYPHGTHSFLN